MLSTVSPEADKKPSVDAVKSVTAVLSPSPGSLAHLLCSRSIGPNSKLWTGELYKLIKRLYQRSGKSKKKKQKQKQYRESPSSQCFSFRSLILFSGGSLPLANFTIIDYMYHSNAPTKRTQPKLPFNTKFPAFRAIARSPNTPHPLDKSSWFDSSLSLPPPRHLLTLDDDNSSLFDVNFSRKEGLSGELAGHPQNIIHIPSRTLCFTGWHSPHAPAEGGPFYVLDQDIPNQSENKVKDNREDYLRPVREFEAETEEKARREGREIKPNEGSMSLFYGGGREHPNSWRYRGDVKIHKQIKISPSTFAQMGEDEKSQWINYFRFENVVERLQGGVRSPKEFFDYLSTVPVKDSNGLVFTILRVTGYDEERINGWMEKHRKRSKKMQKRKEEKGKTPKKKKGKRKSSTPVKVEGDDSSAEGIPSTPDSDRRSRSSRSPLLHSQSFLFSHGFASYRRCLTNRCTNCRRQRCQTRAERDDFAPTKPQIWYVSLCSSLQSTSN